jgi:hypothetical protein
MPNRRHLTATRGRCRQPSLVCMSVGPDAAPDAALGPAPRHLELDLELVERVHEEHGDCGRADSGESVVDNNTTTTQPTRERDHDYMFTFITRTIACVGKKLGCDEGFGVDMRSYGTRFLRVWGPR